MAKYFGHIGYRITKEKPANSGIWIETIEERPYYGDVINYPMFRNKSADKIVDDFTLDCKISIVADPFAYQHYTDMKYVEHMNQLWEVQSIDPQYPRLILTIGGLYHGEPAGSSENFGADAGEQESILSTS